jgi:hypothetical protein
MDEQNFGALSCTGSCPVYPLWTARIRTEKKCTPHIFWCSAPFTPYPRPVNVRLKNKITRPNLVEFVPLVPPSHVDGGGTYDGRTKFWCPKLYGFLPRLPPMDGPDTYGSEKNAHPAFVGIVPRLPPSHGNASRPYGC